MSDMEMPGEVLSQAVVAHAVGASLADGERHGGETCAECANCGTELTARFCGQCGQSAHVHHSLLHMVEELLHGIFHFETKAWRTVPLLMFRPGRLTREYVEGRRVRYVGPLPLFLFMMFLMFMTFSLTSSKEADPDTAQVGAQGRAQAAQVSTELKGLKAELAALPVSGARRDEQQEKIEALESKLADLTLVPDLAQGKRADGGEADFTEASIHRQLEKHLPSLARPGVERKLAHALQNRELALYKIKSGAAKFAILLVPITLPFLWLLFAFRRQYKMFDHAVFSFYSLSAMAVWMTIAALLDVIDWGGTAGMLVFLAPPLHVYAQLRGAYVLTRWDALWRTLALLVYAGLALLAYFAIVVLVSM